MKQYNTKTRTYWTCEIKWVRVFIFWSLSITSGLSVYKSQCSRRSDVVSELPAPVPVARCCLYSQSLNHLLSSFVSVWSRHMPHSLRHIRRKSYLSPGQIQVCVQLSSVFGREMDTHTVTYGVSSHLWYVKTVHFSFQISIVQSPLKHMLKYYIHLDSRHVSVSTHRFSTNPERHCSLEKRTKGRPWHLCNAWTHHGILLVPT